MTAEHNKNNTPVDRNSARLIRLIPTVFFSTFVIAAGGCAPVTGASADKPTTIVAVAAVNSEPIRVAARCDAPPSDLLESVVRVASLDGGDASGAVVAPDRVRTAAHVVDGDFRALVYINRSYRDAQVVAIDRQNDLALLDVETEKLRALSFSESHLMDEEPVWAVGYPLALELTTTSGHFQNTVNGALYTSAPINAGASGGGLFRCDNGHYELAGMIRGYGAVWRGGRLMRVKDLSISVPAREIVQFATRHGTIL